MRLHRKSRLIPSSFVFQRTRIFGLVSTPSNRTGNHEAAPPDADRADAELERVLKLLIAEDMPVKQVAKLSAAITGSSKNTAYERALALKNSP